MVSVAKLFGLIKHYSISPHCLLVLEEMAGSLLLSGAALHRSRSWFHSSLPPSITGPVLRMSICISAHRWQKPRGKQSVTSQRAWVVASLGSGISAKLGVTSEQERCCACELLSQGHWVGWGLCAQLTHTVGDMGIFATTGQHSQLSFNLRAKVQFVFPRTSFCPVHTHTPLLWQMGVTLLPAQRHIFCRCPVVLLVLLFPSQRTPSTDSSLEPKFQVIFPARHHQSKPT